MGTERVRWTDENRGGDFTAVLGDAQLRVSLEHDGTWSATATVTAASAIAFPC